MSFRRLVVALVATGMVACAHSQSQPAPKADYQPQVGQAGKDVIWVPTPEALVDRMLTMAKVTPNDFVVDLGSGDGRTVIAAAKKFGAYAMGVEFNPEMVALSQKTAEREGVADKAKFVRGDIFETDFSKATVVTLYLLPDLNLRLRPKLLDMKPGTRIVSHAFNMGDWEPDEKAEVEMRTAMLWIVPAKVAGTWTLRGPDGSYDLAIQQKYQKLEGSVRRGNTNAAIADGRVNGENVSFTFTEGGRKHRFIGKVTGDQIVGALDASSVAQMNWVATRKR